MPTNTDRASIRTLFDMLTRSRDLFGDKTAFVWREGEEERSRTFGQFYEEVLLLARGLRERGVRKGDRVLFFSDNRYEWILTDLALVTLGAVSVPRGSESPGKELDFIARHSGASFMVVEKPELLERHAAVLQNLPLQGTFLVEGTPPAAFPGAIPYAELRSGVLPPAERSELLKGASALLPTDIVTIIYTSGTTGNPKGVVLIHENLAWHCRAVPELYALTSDDLIVSILPSWHIFERALEYVVFSCGICLVYSSIRTFAEDLLRYRPTFLVTVPRLWESLYGKVNAAVAKKGRLTVALLGLFIHVSSRTRRKARFMAGRLPVFSHEGWLWRGTRRVGALVTLLAFGPLYPIARLKLKALRNRFGGRVRVAVSGGGSLPPYLDQWLDAIGIRVSNAYGMTECAPGIALRSLQCKTFAVVGPSIPGCEVRLAGEDGAPVPPGEEGEVQVRGPQVMPGYHDNPEENARTFTADGFLRTGDLGRFTLKGELVLTGRAKDIIVLASGENVDPTRVEGVLTMFPFIKDAVVVGQDRKGLGALLVPEPEALREFVNRRLPGLPLEGHDLLSDRNVLEKVKGEINRHLHPDEGFHPFERLVTVGFLSDEFQPGEEVTNSFKKRRHRIEKTRRGAINALYAD